MTDRKAILSIDGQAPIELPVLKGTLGQDVIDIGSLGSHGFFTYDPGFSATAACQSDITYIDGDKGVLLHRGYPIEELAEKSDYLETCYLRLKAHCPTHSKKKNSSTPLQITLWLTVRLSTLLAASATTLTQWQCSVVLLAQCRRSTMTHWTSPTKSTEKSLLTD